MEDQFIHISTRFPLSQQVHILYRIVRLSNDSTNAGTHAHVTIIRKRYINYSESETCETNFNGFIVETIVIVATILLFPNTFNFIFFINCGNIFCNTLY